MSEGKIIFDGIGPRSQPVDAVKSMIEFFDGKACERLPKVVMLANNTRLTRSGKGDCYYVSSKNECSCPGFHYHRSCKHIKALGFLDMSSNPVREAVVKEHVIDLHDTKPGEVEYWQKKEQQQTEKLSPGQQLARNIQAMES